MRFGIAFLIYLFVELVVTILAIYAVGFTIVVALFAVGFIVGVWVMSRAGTTAATTLRDSSRVGELPSGDVGDSALMFAAGGLIAVPGFVTDLVGVLLLIPPLRRGARKSGGAFATRYLQRRGYSIVTSQVGDTKVTRVMEGDVISGDVIGRRDADQTPWPPRPDQNEQLPPASDPSGPETNGSR